METGVNTTHAIRDQIEPVFETVEKKARQARRAIVKGRHTAEDLVADTTLRVRRQPLRALAAATLVGAIAGGLCGMTFGWAARGRRA